MEEQRITVKTNAMANQKGDQDSKKYHAKGFNPAYNRGNNLYHQFSIYSFIYTYKTRIYKTLFMKKTAL